LIFIHQM